MKSFLGFVVLLLLPGLTFSQLRAADSARDLPVCTELGPMPIPLATRPMPGQPESQAAGLLGCQWDKPSLQVRFLDGDQVVQAKVKAIAAEWTKYSGISFVFSESPNADIRISFRGRGSWSYIGPCWQRLGVPQNQPTMNFDRLTPTSSEEEYRRFVLHEFGHALGLVHEHQSPAVTIAWDKEKVYKYYEGLLTRQQVDENIFHKYSTESTNYTAFDPDSIMLYYIPNEWTLGDFETKWNTKLSVLDKNFVKVWYTRGPWTNWTGWESEYMAGDWDETDGVNLAVRRDGCALMDVNYDRLHDKVQCFGNGNSEDQYLIGDWDGDGRDNLAVRRDGCVLLDFNFDSAGDRTQCFGNGRAEDEYLVGDWDGDGRDNLAVRRDGCVLMDFNFDAAGDTTQCFGNGRAEDQYLVGDWDGDGKDNLAVRRDSCVLMDFNFDAAGDKTQLFWKRASGRSIPSWRLGR